MSIEYVDGDAEQSVSLTIKTANEAVVTVTVSGFDELPEAMDALIRAASYPVLITLMQELDGVTYEPEHLYILNQAIANLRQVADDSYV